MRFPKMAFCTVVVALAACGGGGGDDGSGGAGGVENALGFYGGPGSDGAFGGWVLSDGTAWLLRYDGSGQVGNPPGLGGPTALIQGTVAERGGRLLSERMHAFDFQAPSIMGAALDLAITPRTSLSGTLSVGAQTQSVTMAAGPSPEAERDIAGDYLTLASTIVPREGMQSFSLPFRVAANGAVSGSNSGAQDCSVSGRADLRGDFEIYDILLTIVGADCRFTGTFDGIAWTGQTNGLLLLSLMMIERDRGSAGLFTLARTGPG